MHDGRGEVTDQSSRNPSVGAAEPPGSRRGCYPTHTTKRALCGIVIVTWVPLYTCVRGLCRCICDGSNICVPSSCLIVEISPSRYQMRSRKRRGSSSTLFCTEFCRLSKGPSSIGGGFVEGNYVRMKVRVRATLLFIKDSLASCCYIDEKRRNK